MKKLTLLALAMPALFAACSQEDFVTGVENQQSAELLGKVAGDVSFILEENPLTRVAWADGTIAPEWKKDDKFSLFWVGEDGSNMQDGVYKAAANAVYYDNNGQFESQSVIYVGKHIIVYPADLSHVTDKKITVSVGAEQEESTAIGERTILVSDKLLDIKAPLLAGQQPEEGAIYAGYNKPVQTTVAPLTTNALFNLNFTGYLEDVVVKKVELIAAEGTPFVTEANLNVNLNGHVSAAPTATSNKLTVNFAENTTIPEGGVLPVHFSMLPSVVAELGSETKDGEGVVTSATYKAYKIKVYTNYGVVTIDNAKQVYKLNGEQKIYQYDFVGELPENFKPEEQKLSFYHEFLNCAVREEKEGAYGNHMIRTVTVDMATADINGMVIETSQDLIDCYAVYKKLGKTNAATFNLNPQTALFVMTKQAADLVNATDYAQITLENVNVTKIELQNEEGSAYTSVPSFTAIKKSGVNDLSNIVLHLGAGNWTLNVADAANFNAWKQVINHGTLNVKSEAVAEGETFTKRLNNDGVVNFTTALQLAGHYSQTDANTAQTNINANVTFAAGKNVAFDKGAVTIIEDAEVYFAGTTTVAEGVSFENNGYLNAAGAFTNNGEFVNNWAVNVAGAGSFANAAEMNIAGASLYTYITNNNGTIAIEDRNEELRIAGTYGTVVYTAKEAELNTGAIKSAAGDKFNKLVVTKGNIDLTGLNNTVTDLELAVNDKSTSFTLKNNALFSKLIVGKAGNTALSTIAINGTGVTVADLTIMPKTQLHITTGNSMTFTGDAAAMHNDGTLLVGGTFTATVMTEPTGADVDQKYKEAGGSIVWN